MNRWFARLLALTLSLTGWMLCIFLSYGLIQVYGDFTTGHLMLDVNGMTFGSGKNPLVASVTYPTRSHDDGYEEIELLQLTIKDIQGHAVFQKELSINHDLFGSGFLKALQVDDDPELEIVFCVSGFQNRDRAFSEDYFVTHDPVSYSFYLDINDDNVTVQDFMTAPENIRHLAESRLLTLNPLAYVMTEILLSPVMIIFGYLLLMRWFNKRLKSRA